jgi:hypothetical protein
VYDAYFLCLERKYRGLYEQVRKMSEEEITFSMSVDEFKIHADKTLLSCLFSSTLLGFYGTL